jgi:hypothetical protein
VSRNASSQWQREASVPEAEFERYLSQTREAGKELSSEGLLALARQEVKARDRLRRLRKAERFHFEPDAEGILTGDVGCLESRLKDGSADLFLCDPPWGPESLHLYGEIAALAAKKLRPGALCLAYCGKFYLDQVLALMGEHLAYWWLFVVTLRVRKQTGVIRRRIEEGYRPVVAFARPPLKPAPAWLSDLIPGSGREKDWSELQQAQAESAYLIENLTDEGALVVDCCAGSGTVACAAKAAGRRWLCAEQDADTADLARARLRDAD